MFRTYIVPHLPSSVPEIQKGKYSVLETGFFFPSPDKKVGRALHSCAGYVALFSVP
jgi:hypothetical protein